MSQRDIQNRYRRKRYANDPEYRARLLANDKARRDEINARKRERYRHDPEYRAKVIERVRRRRQSGSLA
jgi:hypothetical protein